MPSSNPAIAERNLTIAQDRLAGATYRELSKRYGLATSTLHEILTDDEIKDVIETGTKEMIALVPKALDNYTRLLASGNDKIRLEASRDVTKNVGISPSHTQNQVIVNMFSGGADMAPEVLNLLRLHAQSAHEIIDIDLDIPDAGNIAKVEGSEGGELGQGDDQEQ